MAGRKAVGAPRSGDGGGDGLAVLGQAGELVPVPDLHAELAGTLGQDLGDAGLGDEQREERVVLQRGQVQGQRAEDEAGGGPRGGRRRR
ncbi:hypothetical protein GCM10017559_09530 [Streptosporangium longisporum]|uniref:Uncharacterized protein n=1 Tax=Streptosporangium longisporum TaxID=46187 RepID=A0ABN3XRZ0_9ACTN